MIALARSALALSAAAVAGFLVLQALTPMYAFLGSGIADTIFAVGYLAYSVVGALVVQQLRKEVELDAVRSDLLGAVGQTVRPAHASVWLRDRA